MFILAILSLAISAPATEEAVTVVLKNVASKLNAGIGKDRPGNFLTFVGAFTAPRALTIKWEVRPEDVLTVREQVHSQKWTNAVYCDQEFYRNLVNLHNVTITLQLRSGSEVVADRVLDDSLCGLTQPTKATPAVMASGTLEPFDFKGIVAGGEVNYAYLRDCDTKKRTGLNACRAIDGSIGNYSGLAPYVGLYNGRLTSLTYLLDRDAFLSIFSSFRNKYGEPCKKKTVPWRNGAGAVLENQLVVWCFATGELELTAISTDLRYGSAIYSDTHAAPTPAAPRNF